MGAGVREEREALRGVSRARERVLRVRDVLPLRRDLAGEHGGGGPARGEGRGRVLLRAFNADDRDSGGA